MRKRVGFIGCYSNDVILMLAKVLSCMGQKVLLWDRNRLRILGVSVPKPEGVYPVQARIEYDGILFTEQEQCTEDECDIVLIDYGMDADRKSINGCEQFIVLTDMLLHHIRRLEKPDIPRSSVKACIVRDATERLCRGEKEISDFLELFPNGEVFFLPPDFKDVKNRYVCETAHEYSMKNASPEMQDIIYKVAVIVCPEYTERELRKTVRSRERRQYR